MEITHDPNTSVGYAVRLWNWMGIDVWNNADYTLFAMKCLAMIFSVLLVPTIIVWAKTWVQYWYAPFYVALRSEHESTLKKKD